VYTCLISVVYFHIL